MLMAGWLEVGLRIEIFANGQRTMTSPVQSVRVERVDFGADEFDSVRLSEVGNLAADTHTSPYQFANVVNRDE